MAVIDREIECLLPTMSAEDLERAAEQLGGRSPAGRVWLALAAQAMVEDDLETAEEALARLRNIALPESALAEVEDLARQLALRERVQTVGLPTFRDLAALPVPSTMGAEATLGVVLPLSGDFAEFGERCLQGVLLAARLFEEADSDPYRLEDDAAGEDGPWVRGGSLESRVRLLVRDSGGDPERAAAAVRELAERSDVDAIVGPLLSGEAEAAAAAAEAEEVPLVALSLRDEVAQGRPYVFRIRTTPRDEVASLVEHAVTALEARRFAILYPATRYGRGSREAFWRAVDEAGGDVVAVASYDPDATDFADPIRSLIGYGLLTDREKRALRERQEALDRVRRFAPEDQAIARALLRWLPGPEGQPLPPVVDFDVLFIPDAADNVALIAPQLAFHEVGGVRLLGTGDWLDPELLRIGRGHVGGAVIAAPFHVESRFAFVSRFVEDFHATFGGDPDPLAAHAYDAAQLVLLQALAGREDRDDLRDGLLATHGYPGVSGVITMLPDGNARKRPYLLGVQGGGFVSLD